MLLLGNCLDKLKELKDNSIDSIVTDPPYGLSFMGKAWDYDVPSEEIWREAFRVLKPGGHLLSFFGTRTYHRGVIRIEDAGFEIRDQIMWIYGSGFPKSTDVSKRIDKEAGAEREVVGYGKLNPKDKKSYEPKASNDIFDRNKGMHKLAITNPTTDLAKQWQGWGSALKPANEPIVVARKPLEKGLTLAENVLKYGTGAINIDGSRVGAETRTVKASASNENQNKTMGTFQPWQGDYKEVTGRWPANIIFDEEAAKNLDEQTKEKSPTSRFFYVAKASKSERNKGLEGMPVKTVLLGHNQAAVPRLTKDGKPNKPITNQNHHPTVKPIKLMEYLIKLVTPPQGTVLDPFMGSGSTGVAAKKLGFNFIGCEMNEEYLQIAQKRIEATC